MEKLLQQIKVWREAGETIVFTNGVFDILHVGHVTYLEQAAALGNKLIVGVNSDASVRSLNKGPERPINPEWARVRVLEALRCVDAAVVFIDHTPLDLILSIQPNILVKGGDYNPEETDESNKTYMVGSKEVKASGGKAVAIALVEGFSTTNILSKR
jgi:D-beta-D-heptose 7-phosphate kinase/D-beta-D-heptose 1-phosphate adenosyltransferase